MAWRMPLEGDRHERIWMAFPREGTTLGEGESYRESGYRAWAEAALAIADFEPVSMLVDPSEISRARRMLGGAVELIEAPVDEFWMRDAGPTFVLDDERPGVLGAVDWIFNGWGTPAWAEWQLSAEHGRIISEAVGAEHIPSLLVNEGGGIHVDGEGTVLATETVQCDPRRNPHADRTRIEAEFARTIGAKKVIWLPRGLAADYEEFGTNGHVDIVATLPSPGRLLLHSQNDAAHPDYAVSRELRDFLSAQFDAAGRAFDVIDLPAPETLRHDGAFVDYSYINHLVVNGGVIACGFGESAADSVARGILSDAYPGRRVVTVDARPLFARGGGIHCITQQQPAVTT